MGFFDKSKPKRYKRRYYVDEKQILHSEAGYAHPVTILLDVDSKKGVCYDRAYINNLSVYANTEVGKTYDVEISQ